MKVKDLIAQLKEYDGEMEVIVPVQTFTQRYPSGYFTVSSVSPSPTTNSAPGTKPNPRLWVHTPEGFIISEKKKK